MGNEVIGIGLGVAQQVGQGIFSQGQANQQYQNQQNLNLQNQKIQQENWDYTNYENQRKHIEAAGLNVGMMYGMSGGGGATTGGGSGGSTGQATTPQSQDYMGMILGAKQTESTIKLQEAQARKLHADAEAAEMDADTKKHYGKDADMYEAENRRKRAEAEGIVQHGTVAQEGNGIENETRAMRNLRNENQIKDIETRIKTETEEVVKEQMAQDLINSQLDEKLKEAGIELTQEQTRKLWHDIWQGWTNAGFNGLGKIINGAILSKMGRGGSRTEHYDGSDKSYTKQIINK